MIHIRDADRDDLDTLLALGSAMHFESVESFPQIEPDCVRKQLDIVVAMPTVFLVALAEDEGVPIGMMTGVAGPYAFSPRLRTASDLLFVLPERRGCIAAKRLVQRFLGWSDYLGAENATLSVATGVSPERTKRFFKLLGFRPMGMVYQKDCG